MITYLMKFTSNELEVIYTALENLPPGRIEITQVPTAEEVIDKVTWNKVGPDAHPVGAIGVLYE